MVAANKYTSYLRGAALIPLYICDLPEGYGCAYMGAQLGGYPSDLG